MNVSASLCVDLDTHAGILRRKFVILRQCIGDFVPWRLRADKQMALRANPGCIDERAQRHMDIGAFAHHGIEQRAAAPTMDIVRGVGVSIDHHVTLTLLKTQACALDTGERLERRTRRAPALRAMAVEGVAEGVLDLIAHRAAKALAA